ncbi:MAG: MCE family protein [Rhodospirillaceae bacterium]|jgi:phospholipid/cholesterol/gamma-HCH transport system substrate-binding protein|nr:MCE family protein [Rhodospirillaceae bacterium]MBT4220534.1 MCE family protein [Rhodospirillaceae bacterium]MBT4464188.1 MCE family protein [Rhodospirillaceae bacterium]MBT5014669.1 MCE family protein [Rhodospirillaceae bacterium]MBT5309882.1 MCE family protein [Rhodospirillaceae bacterium]
MRNNKLNYVIVGTFVLAMLVGLIMSVVMLTGRTGSTDSYYAIYNNVTGVKFGTQVMYEGYPIGQVDEVTPVVGAGKMSFRVDFSIIEGWRLPNDSVANIAAPGLLSAITISISAGQSADTLKPGAEIDGEENADMFAVVSQVADDLRPLMKTIDGTVGSFGKLLETDITEMVSDLAQRAPRIADNIEDFTGKINQSSDQLMALLTPENREKIEAMISNLDVAATNFTELSGNLDGLVKELDALVVDNKGNIDKSMVDLRYVADSVARHIDSLNQNMEATARNMYEFSRQIRQNPGLLLGGTPPRDEARQ